jgi:hypothetical protein
MTKNINRTILFLGENITMEINKTIDAVEPLINCTSMLTDADK